MPLARAIGRAILRGLAPEGLPINAMLNIARQAGGSYRYQDMRDDARKFTERIKYQGSIERLNVNDVVPRAWIVETELNQATRYRVFGMATYYDDETDQYLQKKVSFYTDDYAKTGDYGQSFFDYFGGRYADEDLEIMEFKTIGLEHNAGWSY